MPVVLVILAALLIVVAYRSSQGQLASALEQDVPGFAKWFGAISTIGGLGYVPKLETLSRWLLALVFTVLLVKNYQQIFAGFADAFSGSVGSPAAPTPAEAYASNPANPQITPASVTGGAAAAATSQASGSAPAQPSNPVLQNISSLLGNSIQGGALSAGGSGGFGSASSIGSDFAQVGLMSV